MEANINLGVSVFLLALGLLFWLIYFQNKKEKHLLVIALTVSCNLLSWVNIPLFFDLSFTATKFFGIIEGSCFTLYFAIIPFTVGIILAKNITKIHWIFIITLLVIVVISQFTNFYISTFRIILMGSSALISIYYIISARKGIKGARWAVVLGLILSLSFTIVFFVLLEFQPDISSTFRYISLVFLLTIFPIGMLVYVSMWFKETRKVVEENATKILQITEEKKELLESQNIILERQVTERTRDLRQSLESLKVTQAQLIQSEKMASLGELTAGIAHEIQNPLNFVNNFSELNKELVQEANEELDKGDIEETKAILKDLAENSEKINHHGKRAGDIVKGMLEHSRKSTGEKVLTDLNALADEFLRLSYYGIRAKDKSFNSDFSTDFDPNLPKVEVIPQDIGRVLLNLINNAFYAVNEKAKTTPQPPEGGVEYKPTVIVKTMSVKSSSGDSRLPDGQVVVQISVQDNGFGIPDSIKEKIFQPFFTTKPTGQGTGLGLSLSYDIVKAHGGELLVESKGGEGSEFRVLFPL
jgi:signal transduction histidine kinase